MRNRASTHRVLLLLIAGFEVVGNVAVYDSALLRGYEPSVTGAVRDLLLYVPLIALLFWLSRVMRFKGNWTLYTTAILLFSDLGYEPSVTGAVRDLLLYVPLIALLFWLSRVMRFKGNWTLYTTAILLFSVG